MARMKSIAAGEDRGIHPESVSTIERIATALRERGAVSRETAIGGPELVVDSDFTMDKFVDAMRNPVVNGGVVLMIRPRDGLLTGVYFSDDPDAIEDAARDLRERGNRATDMAARYTESARSIRQNRYCPEHEGAALCVDNI